MLVRWIYCSDVRAYVQHRLQELSLRGGSVSRMETPSLPIFLLFHRVLPGAFSRGQPHAVNTIPALFAVGRLGLFFVVGVLGWTPSRHIGCGVWKKSWRFENT